MYQTSGRKQKTELRTVSTTVLRWPECEQKPLPDKTQEALHIRSPKEKLCSNTVFPFALFCLNGWVSQCLTGKNNTMESKLPYTHLFLS